jgi:hypothetical protein
MSEQHVCSCGFHTPWEDDMEQHLIWDDCLDRRRF